MRTGKQTEPYSLTLILTSSLNPDPDPSLALTLTTTLSLIQSGAHAEGFCSPPSQQ